MTGTLSGQRSFLESEAAELVGRYPDLQVVGSLGRAAYMGTELPLLRPSGVPRDIDVVRLGDRKGQFTAEAGEHPIDPLLEHWIRPEANGTWLVFPHDERVAEEVKYPDDVFEPRMAMTPGGAYLRVPRPDTLAAISTMQYVQRPKDREAMKQYKAYLDSLGASERLAAELLQPFDNFRRRLAVRRGYLARAALRNGYHRLVPEKVRKEIDLGRRTGWLRSRT